MYFDRNATMSGAQRRGSAGMDRRPNAACVSLPAVWPGWIAGRTPRAFHYRLFGRDGSPAEPPPGELGRVGSTTGCLVGRSGTGARSRRLIQPLSNPSIRSDAPPTVRFPVPVTACINLTPPLITNWNADLRPVLPVGAGMARRRRALAPPTTLTASDSGGAYSQSFSRRRESHRPPLFPTQLHVATRLPQCAFQSPPRRARISH